MPHLTKRQRECMEHVANGATAKEVGRSLGISHRTVELHIAAAVQALGASNRLEAVARFVDLRREETADLGNTTLMLRTPESAPESHLVVRQGPTDETTPESQAVGRISVPLFPPVGGRLNDAPRHVRQAWMIRIAAAAIMLSCAAIISILGLIEMVE